MVTDATLRLCLEQGIGDVDVRYGAEGIADAGILDFCFGETTNAEDPVWRELSVRDPGISEDFVERLIQVRTLTGRGLRWLA